MPSDDLFNPRLVLALQTMRNTRELENGSSQT